MRRYADSIAMTLKAAGINLNLAPVVDTNVNPEHSLAIGYYERSFSADPEVVAQHALEFIKAHHDNGVLTTLKHFPGHGSATTDSHLGFTDVTNTWSEKELIPFQRVIEAGEADVIHDGAHRQLADRRRRARDPVQAHYHGHPARAAGL